jgi:DNA-binding Lrp family transcriptional regulator
VSEKMKAYILLSVQPNKEDTVLKKVSKYPGVINAHVLFGSWDIIAEVEMKDVAELNKFMLDKIRKVSEVTLSATMVVAK